MIKKRRFECYSVSSEGKYWECWVERTKFVSENGRIRAKPRRGTRECGSKLKAKEMMETMIREKTRQKKPWDPHGTYHQVLFLSEDNVKLILSEWLKRQSWKVSLAWRKSRGPDILATKGNKKWIIEVKGQSSSPIMKKTYFLSVLGEILQRMNDLNAQYFIAFPDFQHYRNLWDGLPSLAKSKTGIKALFIDKTGRVREDSNSF